MVYRKSYNVSEKRMIKSDENHLPSIRLRIFNYFMNRLVEPLSKVPHQYSITNKIQGKQKASQTQFKWASWERKVEAFNHDVN